MRGEKGNPLFSKKGVSPFLPSRSPHPFPQNFQVGDVTRQAALAIKVEAAPGPTPGQGRDARPAISNTETRPSIPRMRGPGG